MAVRSSNRFDLSEAVKELETLTKGWLSEYASDVFSVMIEEGAEIGKEAVKRLKAESPKRTKAYSKSWKYVQEKGRVNVAVTVFNEDNYRLTHLLENGHAKRGGGRVQAIPHIATVNEWAQEELVNRVIQRLSEGIE